MSYISIMKEKCFQKKALELSREATSACAGRGLMFVYLKRTTRPNCDSCEGRRRTNSAVVVLGMERGIGERQGEQCIHGTIAIW
jgi:hypothetical protein